MKLKVKLPPKFKFLNGHSRFKVCYGGRGAGRSWSFARMLILLAYSKKISVLCAREIQNSISESVHKLLKEQITLLELDGAFDVTDKEITCLRTGSTFTFSGLYRNVNKIKSMEGIDICWIEEAENVKKESWELLTATIRKDGSEIWVSFNPDFEDDDTYQRFVSKPPQKYYPSYRCRKCDRVLTNSSNKPVIKCGCGEVNQIPEYFRSVEVNYFDNPFFPDVLQAEMEHDKKTDKILYEHKWLGKPNGAGGKVWNVFNKDIHVKDFDIKELSKTAQCFMGIDPHSKYYPFIVWIMRIPKGKSFDYVIYNEYPSFEDIGSYYADKRKELHFPLTLKQLAIVMYGRDGSDAGLKVSNRFVDTRYAKGAGGANWSSQTVGLVQEMSNPENGGVRLELPAEKMIDIQREKITELMYFNELQPLSAFNEPNFYVMPHCKNVIHSLTNHRLVDGSEKEDDKFKDPSDALRICFAGMQNIPYESPQKETPVFYEPEYSSDWMG